MGRPTRGLGLFRATLQIRGSEHQRVKRPGESESRPESNPRERAEGNWGAPQVFGENGAKVPIPTVLFKFYVINGGLRWVTVRPVGQTTFQKPPGCKRGDRGPTRINSGWEKLGSRQNAGFWGPIVVAPPPGGGLVPAQGVNPPFFLGIGGWPLVFVVQFGAPTKVF